MTKVQVKVSVCVEDLYEVFTRGHELYRVPRETWGMMLSLDSEGSIWYHREYWL
jgi:hypothetical protein